MVGQRRGDRGLALVPLVRGARLGMPGVFLGEDQQPRHLVRGELRMGLDAARRVLALRRAQRRERGRQPQRHRGGDGDDQLDADAHGGCQRSMPTAAGFTRFSGAVCSRPSTFGGVRLFTWPSRIAQRASPSIIVMSAWSRPRR